MNEFGVDDVDDLRSYMYNNCVYHRKYKDVSDWPNHSWPCQAWSSGFTHKIELHCVFAHGLVSKNWLLS